MKSKKIQLIVLIIILFGCSKDEMVTNDMVTKNTIKEILEIKVYEQALLAFNTLNPEEMANFWRYKLKSEIETNDFDYQQILHIEELINWIQPDLYIKGKDVRTNFELFSIEWIKDGLKIFSDEELYGIAFQVTKNGSREFDDIEDGYKPKCKCNKSSFAACYFGAHGECKEADCEETVLGCGIIGFSECNGECKL